jgi:hypothetical protein
MYGWFPRYRDGPERIGVAAVFSSVAVYAYDAVCRNSVVVQDGNTRRYFFLSSGIEKEKEEQSVYRLCERRTVSEVVCNCL